MIANILSSEYDDNRTVLYCVCLFTYIDHPSKLVWLRHCRLLDVTYQSVDNNNGNNYERFLCFWIERKETKNQPLTFFRSLLSNVCVYFNRWRFWTLFFRFFLRNFFVLSRIFSFYFRCRMLINIFVVNQSTLMRHFVFI